MLSASASGLSGIIFGKSRISGFTSRPLILGLFLLLASVDGSDISYRVSLLGYEWLVRRITTPAWSAHATSPLHFTGCFGYGNQRKHYLWKFFPQLSCRSTVVSAWPIKRSCMLDLQNLSMIRGYATASANASVELNTHEDVIRFNIGGEHGEAQSSKKGKKTAKEGNISRKAKLNELRFYRLKAKKKMNSPNPEVRIRYKLEKAKRKEAWLIEKLRKYELPKSPPKTYDPEILTEEERFYLKRTGEKKKHYVPVGRRGVFGGVVLNMHLHWKKHETVKVICRPCKPGQALEKYRYEQSLEHTSQFIEKLENELEEYHEHVARYKRRKV